MDLLTVGEAAEFLKVPKSWVYKACMENRISYLKVGRYSRFERSELERYLARECRRGPQVDSGSRKVQQ